MDRDETSLRAAEYVLGLLSASEARQVEADLPDDADLRAEVDAWQARLAVLFEGAEAEPPGKVARELRGELFDDADVPPEEADRDTGWLTGALFVKAMVILAGLLWLLLSL